MKNSRNKRMIWLLIGGLLLLTFLPLTGQAAQTGQVTYATSYPGFYQRGGDPATHFGGQGSLIATTVFESVIDMGVDLASLPSVAKSWKIAPDWSYIDLDIKPGIKFHNGDPLTAEDVKFSMETNARPELKHVLGVAYKTHIKRIEILDPMKVRVHLNMPSPNLWKKWWWNGAIMPKKYREKVGDAGFADKPVGSGPFKWVDYKQDQFFTLEALPQHHRKTAEFKTLKFVYVPEHATRLAMLQAGEVDISQLAGPHIPIIKADPKLRLIQVKHILGTTLAYCDYMFPQEKSPFLDIRVREAASLAIDRKAICDKVLFGGAEPWGEVISPYSYGFDPNIKPDPYDPEKAKKLLAEAGYPNGFKTTMNCTSVNKYWIEAIAANLEAVGIKTELKILDGAAYFDAYMGKKLRGLVTRNSWYDSEQNAGADVQDAYMWGNLWAYVTTKEISDTMMKCMAAFDVKGQAEWGRKLSKVIRESRINMHLWSNHANYGVNQKIVQWDQQLGSFPGTRFEYMKVKN
ncbi:MAG: ABC transporter substrate-binding protein [Thermodesulfobacteriota bacterium]